VRYLNLRRREAPSRRMATRWISWFETREVALLTMRTMAEACF
jgi:hypothetical protein